MDAYSSYIMIMSEARSNELRREAAEYAMSRAARQRRGSLRARFADRFLRPRTRALEPATTIALSAGSAGTAGTDATAELRRSA